MLNLSFLGGVTKKSPISYIDFTNLTHNITYTNTNFPTTLYCWIYFSPDGTKLFTKDQYTLKEYTLSIPWDVSTLIYNNSKTFSYAQYGYVRDFCFSTDGYKFMLTKEVSGRTYIYTWDLNPLLNPFELDSFDLLVDTPVLSYFSSDDILSLNMNNSGSMINTVSTTYSNPYSLFYNSIHYTPLSYDFSGVSTLNRNIVARYRPNYATYATVSRSMFMSNDGYTYVWLENNIMQSLAQLIVSNLSVPWDLTSVETTYNVSISHIVSTPFNMFFSEDTGKLFITDSNQRIHEFIL